jgi:hypothetical protein
MAKESYFSGEWKKQREHHCDGNALALFKCMFFYSNNITSMKLQKDSKVSAKL